MGKLNMMNNQAQKAKEALDNTKKAKEATESATFDKTDVQEPVKVEETKSEVVETPAEPTPEVKEELKVEEKPSEEVKPVEEPQPAKKEPKKASKEKKEEEPAKEETGSFSNLMSSLAVKGKKKLSYREMYVSKSYYLDEETITKLDKVSDLTGLDKSTLVRQVLGAGLDDILAKLEG